MNNIVKKVADLYELGDIINFSSKLEGGITNKNYKIETQKGKYVVKILLAKNYDNIENSEKICEIAKENGVYAIGAIKIKNNFINEIDGNKILVYPYYDGKILKTKEITVEQVRMLAAELAKLHMIKVEDKNLQLANENIEKYSKIDFKKYYSLLKNLNGAYYDYFKENINKLVKIYDEVYEAYTKLSKQISYIHRDYNRKNVLWKNNKEFVIIDWETATVGNPSIDFFKSSWFMTADVQEDKFWAFKDEYFKIMELEDDLKTGALSGLIEECNWLEFSIKRALKIDNNITEEEIMLGKESISSSLKEIFNYYDKITLMLTLMKKGCIFKRNNDGKKNT